MTLASRIMICSLIIPLPVIGQDLAKDDLPASHKFRFSSKNPVALETVVGELAKQTGLEIDLGAVDSKRLVQANYEKAPFWDVAENLAKQSDSRLRISRRGKAVSLVAGGWKGEPAASVDGPFRIAAREVEARLDLSTGKGIYDLTVEVAWEASLPVYRIDSQPRLTLGRADNGQAVTIKPIEMRSPVSGTSVLLRFRLEGLDRGCKFIQSLEGTFRITCAEELLRFTFADLSVPRTESQKGVSVRMRSIAKAGQFWTADIDLDYPPGGAMFESFETYWLGRNRFTLVSPDGKERITTDDVEIGSPLRYRVKDNRLGDLKGWRLEYETPGPIRETTVKFKLKNLPLP